jgi:Arc/MetJ-type ribon-helix-helix transcriptional regulator
MSRLTLHLSDQAKRDAERRAVEGGFESVEAYVAGLVELEIADGTQVQTLLLQRAGAADAGEMQAGDFDAIRAKVRSAAKSGRAE